MAIFPAKDEQSEASSLKEPEVSSTLVFCFGKTSFHFSTWYKQNTTKAWNMRPTNIVVEERAFLQAMGASNRGWVSWDISTVGSSHELGAFFFELCCWRTQNSGEEARMTTGDFSIPFYRKKKVPFLPLFFLLIKNRFPLVTNYKMSLLTLLPMPPST